MSRKRVVISIALLMAAVGFNLILTQWGTDLPEPRLLTVVTEPMLARTAGESSVSGCFTAPFLSRWPWIALVGGILAPLGLLGTVMYMLIRT